MVLGGVDALVALLDHTNFYAVVADLLSSMYISSLIRPVLATTEVPLLMEHSANSTLSATGECQVLTFGFHLQVFAYSTFLYMHIYGLHTSRRQPASLHSLQAILTPRTAPCGRVIIETNR